ncbi:hypothetical protein GCK32_009088 [Trichostrongylus colubriformis]|uniref:RecA family profile 1 domain-containing protein n=1 Tax=Trichostrongylus colubriformis TaxID=6319 RepID=A0AAN8IP30_TRICO
MNETAIDVLVELGLPLALQTGLPGVDGVLRNNLLFGEASELKGESGSGKSQLCYAIVANTLITTKFNVVWLDSNGSFRSSRLVQYINGRGVNETDVVNSLLDRMGVARVSDQAQLFEALEFIDDNMERNNIRLVVIDNVFEMFDDRQLPQNLSRSAVFQSILGRIGVLTDIGCTVLITNSEGEEKNDGKAAWMRRMKGQILLKESGGLRTMHSFDAAADTPSRQCCFQIHDSGLGDVKNS